MIDKITVNCQSSIKIESDKIIYFDPYKIENIKKDADLIFITHEHYDHYDINSIRNIMKPSTKIIIPDSMASLVLSTFSPDKVIGVKPNEDYNIEDILFTTIPSYNLNKQYHPKENNWVGYILNIDGELIYVAGDTDVTSLNRQVICDIALVPIGGTYTMNIEEAALLINEIRPKAVIPTHYGCIVGKVEDGEEFKKLIDKGIRVYLKIGR